MDENQVKFEAWKRKNEESMHHFINVRFKELIEVIDENWIEIQRVTRLASLEEMSSQKLREHINDMIEKILEQTRYIDENLQLITTHFNLNMPAKVTSENGDELHFTTCNEVLARIKCSQIGARTIKDSIYLYTEKRAEYLSKVAKYPGTKDRRELCDEFDFTQAIDVSRWFLEIQYLQLILYKVFKVNKEALSSVVLIDDSHMGPAATQQFSYFG
jgi:hypothetical protein